LLESHSGIKEAIKRYLTSAEDDFQIIIAILALILTWMDFEEHQ
jgi:hypothetical protein